MIRKLRPRSIYDVFAALALFVALGTGGAYASHELINSSDVVDESLTSADIQNLTLTTNDLGVNSVWGTRIRDNGVFSNHVAPNSLTGNDIDEQTFTAPLVRAYVRVDPDTCTELPFDGSCTIERSKGVTSVKRSNDGVYCVRAPAVSSQNVSAAATVDGETAVTDASVRLYRGNQLGADSCDNASDFGVVVSNQAFAQVFRTNGAQVNVTEPEFRSNCCGFQLLIP